jgi:hypothetical protein
MYVPYALVVIAVLAIFVRGLARFPYLNALCVVAVSELLGRLILSVAGWTAPSSPFWPLDYVVLLLSAVVGTAIGVRLRAIGKSSEPTVKKRL